jgi:hypothetical protein
MIERTSSLGLARLALAIGVATSCTPSPVVPDSYRVGLTAVCDAIDQYEASLSLGGSGSIIEGAVKAEAARAAAGGAFKAWVALPVPGVTAALRAQVEEFRMTPCDLINRPADIQADCRALEAALR